MSCPTQAKGSVAAWLTKKSWDEPITGGNVHRSEWHLNVFSDANQEAYAAVVYVITVGLNGVCVHLVQAK